MTPEDEYDGAERLRRALSVAAAAPPSLVDPAAARRAGDARVRTRTAITTSLAFSLVIFAGLGSVYFAAHRSRPSSLGSDNAQATPIVSVSTSPTPAATTLTTGFEPPLVTAGRSSTLFVTGPAGFAGHYVITWGDDSAPGGLDQGNLCELVEPDPGVTTTVYVPHTYVSAGPETVSVRTLGTCGDPVLTASFKFAVAPAATPPAAIPPAAIRRPKSPSPSVSATPTSKPTRSATPPSPATGTATATATATAPATAPGTARPTPRPSGSAKPTPLVSVTASPSRSATATSSPHQTP